MERTGLSRNANAPKVEMAAATILSGEKRLQFLFIRPILTKLGEDVANSMLNKTVESEMSTRIKFKDDGCHHTEFRKNLTISIPLNRFSPNMLPTSNTGLLVGKRRILLSKTISDLNVR